MTRSSAASAGLRGLLLDCRRLLSQRGEANSVKIAQNLMLGFGALSPGQQEYFFERLANDFGPEPARVLACAQAYASAPDALNLKRLIEQVEPPGQELLRRINRSPGGTAGIVAMRKILLQRMARKPALQSVESDFLHLLSSWFNPGLLQLVRVDWNSPAQLLEKIIQHEAVHQIDGWEDLRRRLQPDRRCFAFMHPQLPNEPLIFVEVALLTDLPNAVGPLIAKDSRLTDPAEFKVAAFYSISNCQPGLRGVSLGNFLIKRVAEELRSELPQLNTFCTLSPIPGFVSWVRGCIKNAAAASAGAPMIESALHLLIREPGAELEHLTQPAALRGLSAKATRALLCLGANFLVRHSTTVASDRVARFHLDNGARLERLNLFADLSPKGLRESFGLMVNNLYDLNKVELHHEKFTRGEVAHSRAIAALLRSRQYPELETS